MGDRVIVRYELGLLESVFPGVGRKIPFDYVHDPGTCCISWLLIIMFLTVL